MGKTIHIEAGFGVSFFIVQNKDGEHDLYSCGDTKLSLHDEKVNCPTKVKTLKGKAVQVETGPTYAALVNDEGKLFMWGDNTFGQCG